MQVAIVLSQIICHTSITGSRRDLGNFGNDSSFTMKLTSLLYTTNAKLVKVVLNPLFTVPVKWQTSETRDFQNLGEVPPNRCLNETLLYTLHKMYLYSTDVKMCRYKTMLSRTPLLGNRL